MLSAVRRLAGADYIALVTWVADDVVELTDNDPALVPTQALRAPPSWVQPGTPVIFSRTTPRQLVPAAMLHALPALPGASCLVHGIPPVGRERGTSLLLVWLDAAQVPEMISHDPAFLQHLLVGRAPKARSAAVPAIAARLDAIMAHVPQGIIFVDDLRGEAIINAAAARWLRVQAGILTRPELARAMAQLHDRVRNRAFVAQEATRIADDPTARIDDWSWEMDDADNTTLRVMSVPVTDAAGRGRLWTFDDVSHERALLRQLARHRAFEEKLRQVQKLELVGRLAASVAHDFNNLLTIIAGSAEVLQDAPLDAERRGDLLNIEHATDRARRLTRQLLTFTRQQVEHSESFPIDDRLRETASLLNKVLAPAATLELQLAADNAQVYADPHQIELALLNLLANARDAMPAGGRVTLSTCIEQLADEHLPGSPNPLAGTHVAIAVQDSGSGFDDATRARMFEPFFTTKPSGQGTGLGLATVLAIAQRAGGGVRCEALPGAGARFTLLLPRTHVSSTPNGAAVTTSAAADAPRQFVLLVDDDPGPRDTLRRLLAHEGFMVEVADSGPVALRVLETRGDRCLAIVTDYMMPQMSGRELLERLRVRWPLLPALLISGFTPDDGTAGMLKRLNVGFLAKPFTGRELAAAIRQHTRHVDDADAPISPVSNPA